MNTSPKAVASVLIVDDQDSVRALLCTVLRARGIGCWPAANSDAAIRLLEQHVDEIQVALIDLTMPGLDGLATVKALHAVKPELRCVIATGTATTDAEDLLACGAVGSINKPFDLDELYRLIARWAQHTDPVSAA